MKDTKRNTLLKSLGNNEYQVGKGYYYLPSVNNNKINSASQVLEFDGNRFLHKGIFIRDSLNTIFNHE